MNHFNLSFKHIVTLGKLLVLCYKCVANHIVHHKRKTILLIFMFESLPWQRLSEFVGLPNLVVLKLGFGLLAPPLTRTYWVHKQIRPMLP